MPISFQCGRCGKQLTTGDDKAGRTAKCPGCGEALVVPQPIAPLVDDLDGEDEDDAFDDGPDDHTDESGELDVPGTRICPMCGAENARSVAKCHACGESLGEPKRKPRKSTALDIGATLSTAWEIFRDNLLITAICGYVMIFLMVVCTYSTMLAAMAVIMLLDPQEDAEIMLMIAAPISAVTFLTLAFLGPGYAQLMLAAARGDDVRFGLLFSGGRYFLRGFVASLIFYACLFVGSAACLVPGAFVALVWWSYLYVLVDEDAPGLSCLTRAREIMDGRWLDVFVIGMVGGVIHYIGNQLCCAAGLTWAYFSILFALTYLRLTGQHTADEGDDEKDDEDGAE